MRARRLKLVGALALLGFAACATTPRGDPALDRLEGLLDDLQREAAGRAGRERALAELALQRAREGGAREREHLLELAERRIEIARAAAEAERLEAELAELERERDRILLEASRRDAELARLEAEKLRLQSLARAEEAERLRDKAEIERRRQEELAAAAELARAEAERAQRLAELRAREAEAARREAALAQAAAEALRQQLQNLVAREEARGPGHDPRGERVRARLRRAASRGTRQPRAGAGVHPPASRPPGADRGSHRRHRATATPTSCSAAAAPRRCVGP
ncbi:MAG: hypothetical protein RML12_01780 [Xanthomonadales bacterium]|nr:hypothetical protein [Xanthomonadales bacterium]